MIGGNLEQAEDGVGGESAGIGVEAGLPLNRRWTLDLEVRVPGYFETNGGQHRDILFNVSAVRYFDDSGVRPFAVIGAGFGIVQQRSESGNFDGSETYLVFGGGVQIPVGTRLAIVPEVRVNYAISALIVRPQVGITGAVLTPFTEAR